MEKMKGALPCVIKLPWAPSVNSIWRSRAKQVYISKRYKEFLESSKCAVLAQKIHPIDGSDELYVSISLYPPSKRSYDVDNRAKAILDALTNVGFWPDDSIVKKLTIEKKTPVSKGAVIVEVDRFRESENDGKESK